MEDGEGGLNEPSEPPLDLPLQRLTLTFGTPCLARIFLSVDLREFFFRFRVWGRKKINKKALKMTSKLVIFGAFIIYFFHFQSFSFFFNISRKYSKTIVR